VGTPLALPALTRTGHLETAYRLLLNRDCPGWLYQVDNGATTIWERWDAVRPDGGKWSGNREEAGLAAMISFNHYAYGAVVAWLYNAIAGLNLDMTKDLGEQLTLVPLPGGSLKWARSHIGTPYGRFAVGWKCSEGGLSIKAEVPAGTSAVFTTPSGWRSRDFGASTRLASGHHALHLEAV
jgi:alpha-L-rhamnosidase